MTRCAQPIDDETLLAYWLGELPAQAEAEVEAHYFACASCARRLEGLAATARGIRALVRDGALRAVITPSFLEHLKRAGLHIREYTAVPGDRVACTLRAEDDAVAGRIRVPLAGVKRLDALQRVEMGGDVEEWRTEDVPFEPQAGEVILLPSAARLRTLPANVLRVRLVAVDETGERPLGEVTFAHTPG
jgi:anti-sigma factor RsiW